MRPKGSETPQEVQKGKELLFKRNSKKSFFFFFFFFFSTRLYFYITFHSVFLPVSRIIIEIKVLLSNLEGLY